MKKRYPNEWLLITEYDSDESGHLLSGIVARHSPEKEEVFRLPSLDQSSAFKYTGKSTFPGGWISIGCRLLLPCVDNIDNILHDNMKLH